MFDEEHVGACRIEHPGVDAEAPVMGAGVVQAGAFEVRQRLLADVMGPSNLIQHVRRVVWKHTRAADRDHWVETSAESANVGPVTYRHLYG